MAKGRNARKKAHREKVVREQTEREELVEWLNVALKRATFRQEDVTKPLALIAKRLGRWPTLWEQVEAMEKFRKIEQGNIPQELKEMRFKGKGGKRKR